MTYESSGGRSVVANKRLKVYLSFDYFNEPCIYNSYSKKKLASQVSVRHLSATTSLIFFFVF